MEEQISLNDLLRRVLDRFDYSDGRMLKLEEKVERMDMRITNSVDRLDRRIDDLQKKVDGLEKKVDENHVNLLNRIDEVELKVDLIFVEQKALREEQKVINTKIDDRVTALETWRNSYSS